MKLNITAIMQQKKLLQKSHCKHVLKHRKHCNVQTCLILCVVFNAQNSPARGHW